MKNKTWHFSERQASISCSFSHSFFAALPNGNCCLNVSLLLTEPIRVPRWGFCCRTGSACALQSHDQHHPRSSRCSGGHSRDVWWCLLQWHPTEASGTPRPRRQQHPEVQRRPHCVCPGTEPTRRAGRRRLHDPYARQSQARYTQGVRERRWSALMSVRIGHVQEGCARDSARLWPRNRPGLLPSGLYCLHQQHPRQRRLFRNQSLGPCLDKSLNLNKIPG